ncbi:type VI secretion system Vgr family protein [Azorhizobium doebereinerae]|uniref:type VI secretion system Vgr family protein n=1 Tax=Azorhizobium doebereinerae TaxID=281091 RepID=UPI00041B5ACD|nr:type VI secretion system tip protein TssI/VgrG [Azorhizobium doebereinerae]
MNRHDDAPEPSRDDRDSGMRGRDRDDDRDRGHDRDRDEDRDRDHRGRDRDDHDRDDHDRHGHGRDHDYPEPPRHRPPRLEPPRRPPHFHGGPHGRAELSITVSIPALEVEDLDCEAFKGREAISAPYRFEAFVVTPTDLAGKSAAGKPAWVTVSAHGQTTTFAGVVLEFRVRDKPNQNDFAYSVVVAPRLSLLDFSQQTEVFAADAAMDLKALVTGLLDGSLSKGSTTSGHGQKLDFTVSSTVPAEFKRSNITKYNETDLAFFSRVCEHYGVFYYVSTDTSGDEAKDKITVGARNTDFAEPVKIRFKGECEASPTDEVSVTSFTRVERPQVKQVRLRDYNEATPGTDLISASTSAEGVGEIVEYGDNFPDDAEGKKLASIRAEELAWQASVFEGRSTFPGLRAGATFTLEEHPIDAFNTTYVVVEVAHAAGAPAPLGFTAGARPAAYANDFVAIRKDRAFRPRRVTPRPVMSGVFNALVDAESNDKRASLDDAGRYRVRFSYNDGKSHTVAGKASAALRQLQPYAGASANSVVSGLHMPLLKDAEVLVGYVNGDPDRPVIVGAAYNGKNADPVTKASRTVNRLRTTAGTLLEMEDGASDTGTRYLRMDVPKAVGDKPPTGNYLRLGAYVGDEEKPAQSGLKYSTSTAVASDLNGYTSTGGGLGYSAFETKTENMEKSVKVTTTAHSGSGNGILLYSEQDLDVNVVGAALMKFGAGYASETTKGDSTHKVPAGQYTLSTKNGVTITAGTEGVDLADIKITASNKASIKSLGDTSFFTYGTTTKYSLGESFTIFIGFEQTIKVSISLTIQLSGVNTFTIGAATSVTLGAKADLIIGWSAKYCIGGGDMKITDSDMKITSQDMKLVNTDFKFSGGMDGKIVNVAFESVRSKITTKDLDVEQRKLVQKMVDLSVEKASMKTNFVTLEAYL